LALWLWLADLPRRSDVLGRHGGAEAHRRSSLLLRQGDQRSVARAVHAAQAACGCPRPLSFAGCAVEGGLVNFGGMPAPHTRSPLSQRERSDRLRDPGEGFRSIDRPYPLTPALSPWERERTES